MGPEVGGGRRGVPLDEGAAEVGKEASEVGFFVPILGRWGRGPGQGEGAAGRGAGCRGVGGRVIATRAGVGTVAADLPQPSGVASWEEEALSLPDGEGGGGKQIVACS